MAKDTITKTLTDAAEQFSKALPKVTFNKTGYEIRAQMLELAANATWNDYSAKWGQYSMAVEKSDEGTVVSRVTMPPIPGAEQVLETAEKFYNFVNTHSTKK